MRVSYRIDGLKDASDALLSIPEATRALLGEEFRRMAPEIAAEYRSKVRKRSGRLAASIGYNVREDGLQATVGSSVHYSRFIELGTSDTPKFPALYPAFRTSVRLFRKRMANVEPRLRVKVRKGRKGK